MGFQTNIADLLAHLRATPDENEHNQVEFWVGDIVGEANMLLRPVSRNDKSVSGRPETPVATAELAGLVVDAVRSIRDLIGGAGAEYLAGKQSVACDLAEKAYSVAVTADATAIAADHVKFRATCPDGHQFRYHYPPLELAGLIERNSLKWWCRKCAAWWTPDENEIKALKGLLADQKPAPSKGE